MKPWRAVQELLYERWRVAWADRAPYSLGNEPEPKVDGKWGKVSIQSRPGGPGTIGRPGNRKMDRAGVVFIDLREPPGEGVGDLSDLAEEARDVFENCRFAPFDVRFSTVDIGDEGLVDEGRWWGVTVEARFDYEEVK